MGAFYTKYRRVFFGFFIANVLISMLQLAFAYNHYIKHEWGGLALSLFFASINGLCAVQQYRQWRRVQREEQEYMWQTLTTPSEALR
jgi:MFS-type transporter involved in bile tolerance (Atg22 family)